MKASLFVPAFSGLIALNCRADAPVATISRVVEAGGLRIEVGKTV